MQTIFTIDIQGYVMLGMLVGMIVHIHKYNSWRKRTVKQINTNFSHYDDKFICMNRDFYVENQYKKGQIEKIHARIGGLNKKVDRKAMDTSITLNHFIKNQDQLSSALDKVAKKLFPIPTLTKKTHAKTK